MVVAVGVDMVVMALLHTLLEEAVLDMFIPHQLPLIILLVVY